jgi:large subunit ribosomal protein L24
MSTKKIQTGDSVVVISGKYKKSTGTVSKVFTIKKHGKEKMRVIVSGLPLGTKYQKSYKFANQPGGIFSKERSPDYSNVALVTKDGKPSRVGVEVKDGKKTRVLKKDQSVVTKAKIEKKVAAKTEGVKALKTEKKAKK